MFIDTENGNNISQNMNICHDSHNSVSIILIKHFLHYKSTESTKNVKKKKYEKPYLVLEVFITVIRFDILHDQSNIRKFSKN